MSRYLCRNSNVEAQINLTQRPPDSHCSRILPHRKHNLPTHKIPFGNIIGFSLLHTSIKRRELNVSCTVQIEINNQVVVNYNFLCSTVLHVQSLRYAHNGKHTSEVTLKVNFLDVYPGALKQATEARAPAKPHPHFKSETIL